MKQWGPAQTAASTTCPAAAAPVSITDIVYDDMDRPFRVTASLEPVHGVNRITETTYNADGTAQAIRRGVGAGMLHNWASYVYSQNGLLAQITDGHGYVTSTRYDGNDRLYRTLYPNKTTTYVSDGTDYEQYSYDKNGNLTQLRKRNGQTVSMTYDRLNRLVGRSYPNAADNANRVTASTAGSRTLSYTYDNAGNRTRITWPDTGFWVNYAYDGLNRPTTIRELGATTLATYAYDDLSRRTTVTYGNGTSTSATYNPAGSAAGPCAQPDGYRQ